MPEEPSPSTSVYIPDETTDQPVPEHQFTHPPTQRWASVPTEVTVKSLLLPTNLKIVTVTSFSLPAWKNFETVTSFSLPAPQKIWNG
jgi:hypothetical protein